MRVDAEACLIEWVIKGCPPTIAVFFPGNLLEPLRAGMIAIMSLEDFVIGSDRGGEAYREFYLALLEVQYRGF